MGGRENYFDIYEIVGKKKARLEESSVQCHAQRTCSNTTLHLGTHTHTCTHTVEADRRVIDCKIVPHFPANRIVALTDKKKEFL